MKNSFSFWNHMWTLDLNVFLHIWKLALPTLLGQHFSFHFSSQIWRRYFYKQVCEQMDNCINNCTEQSVVMWFPLGSIFPAAVKRFRVLIQIISVNNNSAVPLSPSDDSLLSVGRRKLHSHGGHWNRSETSGPAGSTCRGRQCDRTACSSERPAQPGYTRWVPSGYTSAVCFWPVVTLRNSNQEVN